MNENNYPKINKEINSIVNENLKKLQDVFPSAVRDGKLDITALKEELGVFEELKKGDEKYTLNWVGKQNAVKEYQKDLIGKTLKYAKGEGVNEENTQNIYIEGDNLEVLKLLKKNYNGEIKMIYIDPPYNTGNDFVYDDDFSISKEEAEKAIGIRDEYNEKLQRNTSDADKYHSNWLNMMYPRLKIARELLTDDGVIFISIDDNEQANLKKICDEIFGEENFIANIVHNTNSSKNQSLFVSVSHDYCLIYAKTISCLKIKHQDNKWSVPKNNVEEYVAKVKQLKKEGLSQEEITEELKVLTKYPRFIDFTNYWYFDERGLYQKADLGGVTNGNMTPLFNPITQKNDPIPPGGFRFNSEKLNQLVQENRIHFHTDGSLPRLKRYLTENLTQRPKSIMSDDQRPDYSMLEEFNTPFDNPKQLAFMQRIVSITDKDSIILDFFSGSATTAHAVMKLNAEDGGNRKFIMVQLPEDLDENLKKASGKEKQTILKAIASCDKNGFPHLLTEIGKERIRRAGKQIKEENPDKNIDIGFKVFRVGETNLNWEHQNLQGKDLINNYKADSSNKDKLDFTPNFTDIDVVYEIMLRQEGLPLTSKIEQLTDIGNRTYYIAKSLVICLEENITNEMVEKLSKITPADKFIFRDSAFETNISLKGETFNRLSALIDKNSSKKNAYKVEFI